MNGSNSEIEDTKFFLSFVTFQLGHYRKEQITIVLALLGIELNVKYMKIKEYLFRYEALIY